MALSSAEGLSGTVQQTLSDINYLSWETRLCNITQTPWTKKEKKRKNSCRLNYLL